MENTLDQILGLIYQVQDNDEKLMQIHKCIDEIVSDEQNKHALKIPDEFENMVLSIAETIDSGQLVYVNKDTLQLEEVIPDMEDPDDFKFNYGDCDWAVKPQFYEWENVIRLAPMDSHDSFRIMEAFANSIDDDEFSQQLFQLLNKRNPFANFKWKIDNSAYREEWFAFKLKRTEAYVRECIWSDFEKNKQ